MSFTIEADPILRVYNVKGTNNLCYDVSGFFSPIAIRDQVIRTCSVIDRAIRHDLITSDRPLLVVGGGIAGITAAIKAVENKIRTIVIEKNKPLSNLNQSRRFFSPIQYDWTATHWANNEFPWKTSKSIPITLIEGSTKEMVAAIKLRYKEMKSKNKTLFKLHQFTEFNGFDYGDKIGKYPTIIGKFTRNGSDFEPFIPDVGKIKEFGMGLSCTGFGRERVFVRNGHPYAGLEYWNIKKFDFVNAGKVLICGGGDGALQDFLLMATEKESAKAIYKSLDLTSSQIDDLERTIFEVEETNARDAIWWSRKDGDSRTQKVICELNRNSQKVHLDKVEQLLKLSPVKKKLDKIVRKEAIKNISLAYPCDHFTGCYPLNRFLALLIGKYIENEKGRKVLHPYSKANDVTGADGHTCTGNIEDCIGKKHKISIEANPICCCDIVTDKPMIPDNPYDIILLRFGIMEDEVPEIFGDKPALPGLQITPYILP